MQSTKKGTSGVLFACVFLPLAFSLFAIFSTQASPDIQSQLVAGVPKFLWLWIACSFMMMLIIIFTALRLTFNKNGELAQASVPSSKVVGGIAANEQKEVNHG